MVVAMNEIGKPFINVSVGNPTMHQSWEDANYISYSINIETNHCAFTLSSSTVRRRYSEFVHLRKMLRNQHPDLTTPTLPSKALFSSRFYDDFIERRRMGLEEFLKKLFQETLYLSNRTVHLFVQSTLPMNRVQLIVEGRSEELIKCEPHLLLNQQHSTSSLYTEVSFDYDTPDYSRHRVRPQTITSPRGSLVTLCTPTLHVPKLEQHSRSTSMTSDTSNSLDSDYYSVLATSSPNNHPSFLPAQPNRDNNVSSSHRPQDFSTENSSERTHSNLFPAAATHRVKKVSFCNEVCISRPPVE